MPALIPSILEEVFSVIKDDNNHLIKFMLAGRESFNIALNYFSRAETASLEFDPCCAKIVVGKKTHEFSFDFPLLKPILKVVYNSIKELEIDGFYSDESKNKAIGRIRWNRYQKSTATEAIPFHILKSAHNENLKIKIARFTNLPVFSIIPSWCHKISLQNTTWGIFYENIPRRFTFLCALFPKHIYFRISFSSIEQLSIRLKDLSITSECMQKMANFFDSYFSNLTLLKITYEKREEYGYGTFIKKISEFAPQTFCRFPSQFKE